MDQPDTGDLHLADDTAEQAPLSPLQSLRHRLGLGFGGGLSQQQIDELIARRKAQKNAKKTL